MRINEEIIIMIDIETIDGATVTTESVDTGTTAHAALENAKSATFSKFYTHFPTKPGQFGVKHFAGEVVYHADNFLEKNRDVISSSLTSTCQASTNPLVAKVFETADESSAKSKKGKTLGGQFRAQVGSPAGADPHEERHRRPGAARHFGRPQAALARVAQSSGGEEGAALDN